MARLTDAGGNERMLNRGVAGPPLRMVVVKELRMLSASETAMRSTRDSLRVVVTAGAVGVFDEPACVPIAPIGADASIRE